MDSNLLLIRYCIAVIIDIVTILMAYVMPITLV